MYNELGLSVMSEHGEAEWKRLLVEIEGYNTREQVVKQLVNIAFNSQEPEAIRARVILVLFGIPTVPLGFSWPVGRLRSQYMFMAWRYLDDGMPMSTDLKAFFVDLLLIHYRYIAELDLKEEMSVRILKTTNHLVRWVFSNLTSEFSRNMLLGLCYKYVSILPGKSETLDQLFELLGDKSIGLEYKMMIDTLTRQQLLLLKDSQLLLLYGRKVAKSFSVLDKKNADYSPTLLAAQLEFLLSQQTYTDACRKNLSRQFPTVNLYGALFALKLDDEWRLFWRLADIIVTSKQWKPSKTLELAVEQRKVLELIRDQAILTQTHLEMAHTINIRLRI